MEKLLSRKDAAARLGISSSALDVARKEGLISYIQYAPNGNVFFTEDCLNEYIAKNTHRAKPAVAVSTYRTRRKCNR